MTAQPPQRPHELTRTDARRIAVRAQLLTAMRPADLIETVHGLSLLQVDPTSAVAPSAQLVLWSRLGSAYDPRELTEAIDQQRVVDFRGTLRPAQDLAVLRAELAQWPGPGPLTDGQVSLRAWVETNRACRDDILDRLRADGPLPTSALPDMCVRPWRSSGWNDHRNVQMMLDLLVQRGEVAAAGRAGRERLWDLADRVYPPALPVLPAQARRLRDERRLGALGIARSRTTQHPVEPLDVSEAGEPAVVEGVRGTWRVDPALLGGSFEGRAALLSPFDRLLHDRRRMAELFEFEYALEMFKPAAARRWGYCALPVLVGDRLVGKLDATADRAAGVLRVNAVHRDGPWDDATVRAVDAEIEDLARWLELDLVRPD
jgi:hypothetical protein